MPGGKSKERNLFPHTLNVGAPIRVVDPRLEGSSVWGY